MSLHRGGGKARPILTPIERVKEKETKHAPMFLGITAGIAVVAVLVAVTAFVLSGAETRSSSKIKNPPDLRVRRAIDGALVAPASSTPRLAAVVIDNLKEAYPLRGLDQAALVYEAPVEGGGTTRLLAFFPEDARVSEIGPVRSLRPYFTDWALELGAMPVHVGGSPAALDEVQSKAISTLNQFFQSEYFWRSGDRDRPHNVFTSSDLLAQGLTDRWNGSKKISSWSYRDAGRSVRGSAAAQISFADRGSVWTWRKGSYLFVTEGVSAQEVRASNVVVMETEVKVLDDIGRRSIRITGSGPATVFTGGKKIVGTWMKKNLNDRISFVAGDSPIQLAPGATWIEVVPKGTKVEIGN